ncbi:hypothetical protein AB0M43_35940 [Longispora sp. NPDC051575]|uniref:hypothetical protein n=1 Tax=Longispora sp. NPDC051575 TaxID=3154943 RepID=UPI003431A1FD
MGGGCPKAVAAHIVGEDPGATGGHLIDAKHVACTGSHRDAFDTLWLDGNATRRSQEGPHQDDDAGRG